MKNLIGRLETAIGRSRELDVEIFRHIGLTATQERYCTAWCCVDGRTDLTRDDYLKAWAPNYTSSLDAALTLVPDGWAWSVQSSAEFPGEAWLYPPDNADDREVTGNGRSAAIALCIAGLKARLAP